MTGKDLDDTENVVWEQLQMKYHVQRSSSGKNNINMKDYKKASGWILEGKA